MNKDIFTIKKKAWHYSHSSYPEWSADSSQCIALGKTIGKARYSLYRELIDCGWGYGPMIDVLDGFKFRRFPEQDLVKMPPAPVLEMLSEKQRHIIGHANGNGDREPGWRDYYCTTDGDSDCEALVELGLMKKGRALISRPTSRYYLLTTDGALAALSDAVITRSKAEEAIGEFLIIAPGPSMLSLEAIKANPDLRDMYSGELCRIYSAQWGYYWRPQYSGYGSREDAGVYTFRDAIDRTHHCGPEKGIWYEFVDTQEVAA